MIYATVNMTVGDYSSKCDTNIVLYRGDRNVEIRFVIKGNRFTVLDSTYAQMIIRRPSATSVFSDPAPIQNDTVVFTISEDMIDELKEIGAYTFQVRLYDNSMNARATLPPCEGCLIINQPIATEGEALVNAAMINDSAVLAAAYSDVPEDEIFDNNNAYNRTVWVDGDIITDVRMNKIENALYYINEKGGGGTATAPYISTSLPETVMVGSGEDFELDLDFSSPNLGKGTLKVFINDVDSMNTKIDQGMSITSIPGSLFTKGTNMVVIYVLDRVGMMSNSLTFYIRYGGTEVSSTFDAYVAYDYGATVRYYFTPTALDTSLQLTFYMEIDGTTQAGVPCVSDVRSYYTFPINLSVGNHYCRAWVTDGTTRSNVLAFNLIILDATSLVVATDTLNPTVEEGTQLVLDYKVYMKNNTSFITKTYVDNALINTGTCTLETAYYRTTNLTAGTHTIKVEVFDVTETYSDFVTWTVTVTESTYTMLEPAKAGSIFMATAYNKSNVDENREVWIGSNQDDDDITASLSNFSFNSENGWIDDALVISGNSWVEIPIQPLANNAQYGFTLDIEFKTKAIGVEDAEVLTLWNETDNCGIKITTEQLIMRSKSGSQCDLYFAEDEIVSAIFVIDRDEKTAKIYLNGVMCEAFALSDYEAAGQKYLEDFTVNSNVYLGGYNKNGYCAIKNIRIYEVALATNEILNNFMSNEKDKAAQRALVEFQKGNTLPTLTIYCDFAGLGKDDKKPCNIVYNSPDVNLYGESFTLDGKHSMLQYQGTSSMQYPIKNYRINPRNADGKVKLDPFNNGVGESRFTLKADFMSSGHWQNTGLAKWVNDKLYNYNVNDESTMNARKWYDLQNGGSLKGTREAINGFPCRLILVNDGETALNEGQQEPTPGNTKDMGIFNFNNDKDNVETLGFDTDIFPNCMSFEVTANSDTSAGAFVPYNEERVINGYMDKTNLYTNYMYQSEWTKLSVNFDGQIHASAKIYWYNELNDTPWDQAPAGSDGSFDPTYRSNPYFQLAFFGLGQTNDITINDITYKINYVSSRADLYSEVMSTVVDENSELKYLQNSFELRYPDADDVGKDYGYLGMSVDVPHIYVKGDTSYLISVNYLNGEFNIKHVPTAQNQHIHLREYDDTGVHLRTSYNIDMNTEYTFMEGATKFVIYGIPTENTYIDINGVRHYIEKTDRTQSNEENPFVKPKIDSDYGLKRVIDWVGNCTDEQFVAEFDQYFHRDYTLRYYLLVITLGMVDNLGKNMMFDTFDGKIWLPRFYDMDTICSYDNSGEIKFDVDIEMEQGYWNTSSSRLWTKIRDLMHDELVEKYNNMRQNGMSYESFMSYFYDKQIAQIPQTYYNKDYDVKYAPYADEYMGKAHGDGYEHLKRWLKRRLIFTDTLFDYAPSYTNDALTIRANTLDLMSLEIETYTPVYQHVSFYNGNMEKIKIDGKTSTVFEGTAQTATDQEVLIYGGSNIKSIKGIQSMNPNSMLIGNATRLTQLDLSDCPILTVVNSNKANFSPHTYLNKLDISNCPQLGGTLNISNSPLLQEVNALGSAVDNILFPTSVRNLETLRVPKTVTSLALNDAGLLYTLEMEEGNNLQNISLTNCNNLTETINFDLTQVPTVLLDNSYNGEELYMSATTNLTLKNMSSLKRVIFTPNSEYSAFDINNVLNSANYKITTFNNPMMTDFITTAPHRLSYKNVEYKNVNVTPNLLDGHSLTTGRWLRPTTGLDDSSGTINAMLEYIEVEENTEYTLESSKEVASTICFYNSSQTFISALDKASNTIPKTFTTPSGTSYMRFDVTNTITSVEQLHLYKTSDLEYIQVKDYGDITPNTAFTANTLDLADTQFQNVKFLCTTDIYNLKVPTTMKNFYCDSAMDIDTDVIEDASYEVIHEELIEPYTTNYEGEVVKIVNNSINIKDSSVSNKKLDIGYNDKYGDFVVTGESDDSSHYMTDYIKVTPNTKLTIPYTKYGDDHKVVTIAGYPKDKSVGYKVYHMDTYDITLDYTIPSWMEWIKASTNYDGIIINYEGTETPNIIPSSANGSLIFNMYSNNTTQPTSTSPYMWDLTGLKLEDFYTYGMNNNVKPSDNVVRRYSEILTRRDNCKYTGTVGSTIRCITALANGYSIPPIKVKEGDTISHKCQDGYSTRWLYHFTDDNNIYISGSDLYNMDDAKTTAPSGATKLWVTITAVHTPHSGDYLISDINGVRVTVNKHGQDSVNVSEQEILDMEPIVLDGNYVLMDTPTSITMPQRMPGYSVRLVNADITPDEYPTMLYPKLIDTTLPITGKLDYTAYKGTSLAWAYAYTTGDVNINPLDSRSQGNITQDYNKLYGTDFVDIVDVWVYKDTDTSKLSTNEAITKAYIELTSANYKTRVDEVLAYYPNCTDIYFFDDGNMNDLSELFIKNTTSRNQIEHITFMEGYFDKVTSMRDCIRVMPNLLTITNLPKNLIQMNQAFFGCDKLIALNAEIPNTVVTLAGAFRTCRALNQQIDLSNVTLTDSNGLVNTFCECNSLTIPPILPTNYKGKMDGAFQDCTSLTQAPVIPRGVTSMSGTFQGCTSLTQAPTIPSSVTNMEGTFNGCTSLTQAPVIPNGVTNMNYCFQYCTSLTTAPNIPDSCTTIKQLCIGCTSLTGDFIFPLNTITGAYNNSLGGTNITNVIWTGERTLDFNLTVINLANWTQSSIKDLVNNHLENVGTPYIEKTVEADYIDIPFGDIDYTKIRALEVEHECNGAQLIQHGTNGVYNQGRTQIGYSSNQIVAFIASAGSTIYPSGGVINRAIVRVDTKGIYENGVMKYDAKANGQTFDPNKLKFPVEYEAPFRIFGEGGYNASVSKNGKLFQLKILGENDVLLHHFLPYKDGDKVGIIDDVTKKTYFGSDTTTFSYGVDSKTLTLGEYASYLSIGDILSAQAKGWTLEGNFSMNYAIINASTDLSSVEVNSDITMVIVELTNDNYKTRLNAVYAKYPSMTDVLFTEDGTVTTLADMFNNSNNNKCRSKIEKIEFLEGYFQNLTNLTYSFYQCSSLTDIVNIPSGVTNMYRTFYYCSDLENVPDLPDGVTNVNYTFYQCDSLVTAPKLGKSTTVLDYTFYGCDCLETVPEFPPNITKLTGTFSGCSKLTSVPDIPNSVGDMSNAFYECSRLVVAPKLPTSVHTLSSTFYGCSSLTTPPSIIPKSVTNTSSCFNGCSSLVTPPEFEHIDGSDLYTGRMYQNCSKMTTAPKIPNGVDNILGMFVGCKALTIPPTIPDSVTNMQEVFNNCTGLTQNPNVPTGVTNLKWAFSNSSITAITIPLTNLTTYDYAISSCPNLTNVTWVGEITNTFNVKNLYYKSSTDNTTPTATDIQELVPEHLGTVTGKTLTLGDYISHLSEEEIAAAVAKGWTIE